MPAGYPTRGSGNRTLTVEQVISLRDAYRAGVPRKELLAVSGYRGGNGSLHSMLIGKSYGWVPGALEEHEMRKRSTP